MEFNLKNIGNAVTHVTGVASHIHSGLSMIAPLFGKKVHPLDEGTTTTPPDQKKKGGLFSIDDEVGYGQLLTELDRKYIGFITGCTNDHYYDFAHPERRDGLKGLLRRAEAERKFDGYRTIVTNMTKNGLRKAQLEEIVKADITRRTKIRLSD
ncbi:hypothetical protein KC730_03400, partial [Candidatus Kaiserbacteria bacterium]|nr:hypothetical protein [Candidatus Kaiserbacteria bacterium]